VEPLEIGVSEAHQVIVAIEAGNLSIPIDLTQETGTEIISDVLSTQTHADTKTMISTLRSCLQAQPSQMMQLCRAVIKRRQKRLQEAPRVYNFRKDGFSPRFSDRQPSTSPCLKKLASQTTSNYSTMTSLSHPRTKLRLTSQVAPCNKNHVLRDLTPTKMQRMKTMIPFGSISIQKKRTSSTLLTAQFQTKMN
jgi:hypothetical protein